MADNVRVRQNRSAMAIGVTMVVALLMSVAVSGPADAVKPPPVVGTIVCSTTAGTVDFSPGLQYKLSPASRGRGPSTATWGVSLSGCAGASSAPAPGGIDHGTLGATDRIAGSYCEKADLMKFAAVITWFRADNSLVGTSKLKATATLTRAGFYDPVTVSIAALVRNSSGVAPAETLTVLLTTSPSWAFSANCGKAQLPGFIFDNSTASITA